MQLSAVILAGGESRRMGRDKAWLNLDGEPLIVRAVRTVRRLAVDQLFISGRTDADYATLQCPILHDLEPGFGPLGGIERALHACGSPLLLVLAVDLPHMTTEFLTKLIVRADVLTGAVPTRDGSLEPLAAIYPKRCHEIAFRFIAQSRHSVCDFADDCLKERAVRTLRVAKRDAACFANWNSPVDATPNRYQLVAHSRASRRQAAVCDTRHLI